jgi:hypothetical protein
MRIKHEIAGLGDREAMPLTVEIDVAIAVVAVVTLV